MGAKADVRQHPPFSAWIMLTTIVTIDLISALKRVSNDRDHGNGRHERCDHTFMQRFALTLVRSFTITGTDNGIATETDKTPLRSLPFSRRDFAPILV